MINLLGIQKDSICQSIKDGKEFCFNKNKHLLIVGKNTSGKTRFIKNVLEQLVSDEVKGVYFIGAYNRTITLEVGDGKRSHNLFIDFSPEIILTSRVSTRNSKDIFQTGGTEGSNGPLIAASELSKNLNHYKNIISDMIGLDLCYEGDHSSEDDDSEKMMLNDIGISLSDDSIVMVYSDGKERNMDTLSSSEVAMIRIIMEIDYAVSKKCKYIFIDEFDNYLDMIRMQKYIEDIVQKYPHVHFILAIHSVEAVINIRAFDVLFIHDYKSGDVQTSFMRFSSDDIKTIEDLQSTINRHTKYDEKNGGNESLLRECLIEYLTNGELSESCESKFTEIRSDRLLIREKVLYEYISRLRKR